MASPKLDRAFDLGKRRYMRDAVSLSGFPHVTRDGEWLVSEHGRWTAGFFIGVLWLIHLADPEAIAASTIGRWIGRLAPRAGDRTTHDMGFLFEPSAIRGYRVTGEVWMRELALSAARSLASRYHERGAFIPAWEGDEWKGVAIIDTIMNLPLLVWAGQESKEPRLIDIARATTETIARDHVRMDDSTIHVVRHDPVTGNVVSIDTHQGASPDSCWTRGHAWAIYGFTRMSMLLRENRYLSLARRLADYFLDELGARRLPPWDFTRKGPAEPADSAAAAIAASGLLDLGQATGEPTYGEAARRILEDLVDQCVSTDSSHEHGLLQHGSADVPRSSGVDETLIYGDHYFLEAVSKLRSVNVWNLIEFSA